MDDREGFEHEPVSHPVAHYLVAIQELLEEYGYARVSDVARRVGNTRGSASITLRSLREKGLVTQDERRFLGLSAQGSGIAHSLRAKRGVFRDLFVRLLGVEASLAEQETCRLEHLVSGQTARRAAKLIRFLDSGSEEARAFVEGFERFESDRDGAGPRRRARKVK
jgi:Mn-dependent DtxR family transcriptional regulator